MIHSVVFLISRKRFFISFSQYLWTRKEWRKIRLKKICFRTFFFRFSLSWQTYQTEVFWPLCWPYNEKLWLFFSQKNEIWRNYFNFEIPGERRGERIYGATAVLSLISFSRIKLKTVSLVVVVVVSKAEHSVKWASLKLDTLTTMTLHKVKTMKDFCFWR